MLSQTKNSHPLIMSGSFERTMYDPQAAQQYLKQSQGPGVWALDANRFQRCNPCRPADLGQIASQGVSISCQKSLVDIDSYLRKRDYVWTHDPSKKPQINFNESSAGLHHYKACGPVTNYSRLDVPICTARGLGINRFQPLNQNPQAPCRWLHPDRIGTSSRLVAKDNHVPCVPKPICNKAFRPKGGKLHCSKKYSGCNV